MKILHVIPSVAPLRGGPSRAVIDMVNALRKNDIDAEIVTTNDNGKRLLDVQLNKRVEYEGVPIWFLPRTLPPMREFNFSIALTRWLWQNINNYDLVHNHYLFSYAPTLSGMISQWRNIPYIIRTLDHLSPWSLTQSKIKKKIYLSLFEQNNLRRAAALHCTSKIEIDNIRKLGIQTSAFSLPLGVEQSIDFLNARQEICQKYTIPPQKTIILFLSRLHPKKRPDLLLRALAQLIRNKNSSFHTILAGSGEPKYIQYLNNIIDDFDLNEHITLAGFIKGNDKHLLLQGADIFVLPSLSENFGIAVAEALASGLAVIVTPEVQIASDISTAHAGIVVEGTEEMIAQAVDQLIKSPQLQTELGRNGKQLAENKYSWNSIANNLTYIYQSIIAKKNLPNRLDL